MAKQSIKRELGIPGSWMYVANKTPNDEVATTVTTNLGKIDAPSGWLFIALSLHNTNTRVIRINVPISIAKRNNDAVPDMDFTSVKPAVVFTIPKSKHDAMCISFSFDIDCFGKAFITNSRCIFEPQWH
jgi:hypothetical protein